MKKETAEKEKSSQTEIRQHRERTGGIINATQLRTDTRVTDCGISVFKPGSEGSFF